MLEKFERTAEGWNRSVIGDVNAIPPKHLSEYVGHPVVIKLVENGRTYLAGGNEEAEEYMAQRDKAIRFDMPCFINFLCYRTLHKGLDVFQRQELREERIAIMEVEGESKAAIAQVIASQPDLYAAYDYPEDF